MSKFRLGVYDLQFIRELTRTLLAVLFLLLLITISNSLVRFFSYVATGEWPADVVFPVLGLNIVKMLSVVLPIASLLSVLIVVGRMQIDNEVAALESCGRSYFDLYKPLFLVALALFLIQGALVIFILPVTKNARALITEKAENEVSVTGLSPGRFQESSDGSRIIYVEDISDDKKVASNLLIYSTKNGDLQIISAQKAYKQREAGSGDLLLYMIDGNRYTGIPGETTFTSTAFKKHWVRLEESYSSNQSNAYTSKPTSTLLESSLPMDRAELHWRLANTLGLPLLLLAALPMGKMSNNQTRYARVPTGILMYIIYFKISRIGQSLLGNETIPEQLGLWWIPAGLLLYTVMATRKHMTVRPSLSYRILSRFRK